MSWDNGDHLRIALATQRMELRCGAKVLARFNVSTARNGPGEVMGSGCTPCGWHYVRAKIGAGAPLGAVFVGRRWTGEIYNDALALAAPQRDWILTRILWLCGLERGRNRGGNCDTMRRYIYIHGAPSHGVTGVPESHGCVRMHSDDVSALFDRVAAGTPVLISETEP